MLVEQAGQTALRRWLLLTLRRSALHQILCAKDDHNGARPVRNGIPEERSQVRFRIAKAIQRNPQDKETDGRDAQAVLVQKFARGGSSTHALNRTRRSFNAIEL